MDLIRDIYDLFAVVDVSEVGEFMHEVVVGNNGEKSTFYVCIKTREGIAAPHLVKLYKLSDITIGTCCSTGKCL